MYGQEFDDEKTLGLRLRNLMDRKKIIDTVETIQYQYDKNNSPFSLTSENSSIFAPAFRRKREFLIA